MRGLFKGLNHQHHILRGVHVDEGGTVCIKLVTQDKQQTAAGQGGRAHGLGVAFLLLRQAAEQYLTSAQFLAQALRQVMSRPQAWQGLLGRLALLPLKPDVARIKPCSAQ